jgi:AcrR family transcriptional regulator
MRRPYDTRSRQAAARRNRAAVLRAAHELLISDGYQATTIRGVAERAGVSPETVYKTFGGKPGLMKALWDVTLAGDDAPVAMGSRPALQAVWQTEDPMAQLRGYAAFVRGVHERVADLFALLTHAGPEVAETLAVTEQERRTGVTAFVTHLAATGHLRAGVDQSRAADACWVITGATPYLQFTRDRGWTAADYEDWLTTMLAAILR